MSTNNLCSEQIRNITCIFSSIFARNMDCGLSQERLIVETVLMSIHNVRVHMYMYVFSINKKNNTHFCKSLFYYIKVGPKGV